MKDEKILTPERLLIFAFLGILLKNIALFSRLYIITDYDSATKIAIEILIAIPFMIACLNGNRIIQILTVIFNLFKLIINIPSAILVIVASYNIESLLSFNSFLILYVSISLAFNLLSSFILFFKGKNINMHIDISAYLQKRKKLCGTIIFMAVFIPLFLIITAKDKWEVRKIKNFQINMPRNWISEKSGDGFSFQQKDNKKSYILLFDYNLENTKDNLEMNKRDTMLYLEKVSIEFLEDYEEISKSDEELVISAKSLHEGKDTITIKAIFTEDDLLFAISFLNEYETPQYNKKHKKILESIAIE